MQYREPFKSITHNVLLMLGLASCLFGPARGAAGSNSGDRVEIFDDARNGNVVTVKAALRQHPELVKDTDQVGRKPLHHAAMGNQPAVIRLLVDAGAEVDTRDNSGYSPLHTAIGAGATEAARTLIELGADYRTRHRFKYEGAKPGISVLDHAAWRGNAEIVNLLLKRGAPVVDTKHPMLNTPLHNACRNMTWMRGQGLDENEGNHLVIDALMKHMDDINIRNFQQHTPLHIAAQVGAADTVEHLLKTYPKVEIDAEAPDGKTALHFAASTPGVLVKSEDRAATIRALLAGGARLLPDSKGQTPLDLARATGDKQVIAAFEGHDK